MLEDVLDLGKRGLFVEKLFVLEGGKQAIQFLFGLGDDLADQLSGNSRPMTASCCSRAFSSGGQAVDAGGQHALHGGGDMQLGRRLLQPVAATFAR